MMIKKLEIIPYCHLHRSSSRWEIELFIVGDLISQLLFVYICIKKIEMRRDEKKKEDEERGSKSNI